MTSYHPAAIPDLLHLPFTPHHIIPTSPPYLLAPYLPSSPSLYNLHVPIPSVPLSILHHTTAPTLDSNTDPLVAYIHRFTALAYSHGTVLLGLAIISAMRSACCCISSRRECSSRRGVSLCRTYSSRRVASLRRACSARRLSLLRRVMSSRWAASSRLAASWVMVAVVGWSEPSARARRS
jgi:hypothetical protein